MPFNPTDRIPWIDATKGIAITLVVIGHAWIGMHSAGLIANEALYLALRQSIYLFHMPLFFVVSGLMTYKLTTLPFPRFAASRVMLLLYPMVLWTYLMNAGKLAMGGLANAPVTWESFNWMPLPPQWQFWFLWALFLLHVATWALARAARAAGLEPRAGFWAAMLGAAILLDTFGGTFGVVDPFVRAAMLHAPFFFLGVLLCYLPALPVLRPVSSGRSSCYTWPNAQAPAGS